MRCSLFSLFFLFAVLETKAADSLEVSFVKKSLLKGDTLEFTCTIPEYAKLNLESATLNVWIDDLEQHKRWKYRYPIINGETNASLTVSDKITDGNYAVTFLVQRGFFKVTGELVDHFKDDSVINYMMIPKDRKNTLFDKTRVGKDGSFRLKSTLFADSAYFIFSPVKKTQNNYFLVDIQTPLDSAFTPVLKKTCFITVGNTKLLTRQRTDTTIYSFSIDDPQPGMLPGVTVTAKHKRKIEQYNEEYSRGLFDDPQAMIFDGLENKEISRSVSVLQFLQAKVPGLQISRSQEEGLEGVEVAKWARYHVYLYLDEFAVTFNQLWIVSMLDIAMIKVFRPPSNMNFGRSRDNPLEPSGTIAIYTKKGRFIDNLSRTKHSFIVRGYTKMESVWE